MVELLFAQPPELDAEALAAAVRETLPGRSRSTASPGDPRARGLPAAARGRREAAADASCCARRDKDAVAPGDYDLSQSWAFHEENEAAAEQACDARCSSPRCSARGAPPQDRVTALQGRAGGACGADRRRWRSGPPAAHELLGPSSSSEHPLAVPRQRPALTASRTTTAPAARHARPARARAAGLPAALPRARSRELVGHLLNLAALRVRAPGRGSRAATRLRPERRRPLEAAPREGAGRRRSDRCSTSIPARRTRPASARGSHTRRVPLLQVPLELDRRRSPTSLRAVRDDDRARSR